MCVSILVCRQTPGRSWAMSSPQSQSAHLQHIQFPQRIAELKRDICVPRALQRQTPTFARCAMSLRGSVWVLEVGPTKRIGANVSASQTFIAASAPWYAMRERPSDVSAFIVGGKRFPVRRLSQRWRCTGYRSGIIGTRATRCRAQTHPHLPSMTSLTSNFARRQFPHPENVSTHGHSKSPSTCIILNLRGGTILAPTNSNATDKESTPTIWRQSPEIRFIKNGTFQSKTRFSFLIKDSLSGPTRDKEKDRILHVLCSNRGSAHATPNNELMARKKSIIACNWSLLRIHTNALTRGSI